MTSSNLLSKHPSHPFLRTVGIVGSLLFLLFMGFFVYRVRTEPGFLKPDQYWGFAIFELILLLFALFMLWPFRYSVELYPERIVRKGPLGPREHQLREFTHYQRHVAWVVGMPLTFYYLYDEKGKLRLSLVSIVRDFADIGRWIEQRLTPRKK